MNTTKWFLASRTIWGLIIVVAPNLLSAFGLDLSPEALGNLNDHVLAMLSAANEVVGILLVLWGRSGAASTGKTLTVMPKAGPLARALMPLALMLPMLGACGTAVQKPDGPVEWLLATELAYQTALRTIKEAAANGIVRGDAAAQVGSAVQGAGAAMEVFRASVAAGETGTRFETAMAAARTAVAELSKIAARYKPQASFQLREMPRLHYIMIAPRRTLVEV